MAIEEATEKFREKALKKDQKKRIRNRLTLPPALLEVNVLLKISKSVLM